MVRVSFEASAAGQKQRHLDAALESIPAEAEWCFLRLSFDRVDDHLLGELGRHFTM